MTTGEVIALIKALSGGGGSGGGALVVTDTEGTLNASYQDLKDAGFAVMWFQDGDIMKVLSLTQCDYSEQHGAYAEFTGRGYVASNKTDNLVYFPG